MELARQTSFPEKSANKIIDEVIEGLKSWLIRGTTTLILLITPIFANKTIRVNSC
jgi:hypothetical protein